MRNYFNSGGFFWWVGCVEDRKDPLQLGRCRVRVVGYHTADKARLPTEDLPWAYPVQPITSAAMNGIGTTPLGPVEGTWVVGFFRDGEDMQEPVFTGTIGGIPQSEYENGRKPTDGFGDPTRQYPIPDLLDEPDTNRLARNSGSTIVNNKNASRSKDISLSLNQGTWDEPVSPYNARYPYNHVTQTESGHVVEFDDTADNERIHLYHKKGTFTEIDKNGTRITRIVGDDYEVLERNGFLYVRGKMNVTAEGSVNIYIKNDCNLQVDGDINTEVHGDYNLNVAGKIAVTSGDDISIKTPAVVRAEGTEAMLLQSNLFLASGSSVAALKGSVVVTDGLFIQPNLIVSPGATSSIAAIPSATAGLFPNPSPVAIKTPSEPQFAELGFSLSPEQRASFTIEKNKAFADANDTNMSEEARQTAREYAILKTEELDSNSVVSIPVKEEPKTDKQYECAVGLLVVAAARLDVGVVETGSAPGLNYGGKPGGGQLPPGIPGRIDAMLRSAGLDNQAEVRRKGSGYYWCAGAVTSWWKAAGLPVPPGPASCKNWESWARAKGLFSSTPKIGAAILYGTPGAAHHIGVVSSVGSDGKITTIEGNTSGGDFNRNGCGCYVKTPRSYIGFVIPPSCSGT